MQIVIIILKVAKAILFINALLLDEGSKVKKKNDERVASIKEMTKKSFKSAEM